MNELTTLRACIESDVEFETVRKSILKTPEFIRVMDEIRTIAKDSGISAHDAFTYIHYGMNAVHKANLARRKAERAFVGVDLLAPVEESAKPDELKEASKARKPARKPAPIAETSAPIPAPSNVETLLQSIMANMITKDNIASIVDERISEVLK